VQVGVLADIECRDQRGVAVGGDRLELLAADLGPAGFGRSPLHRQT